MHEVLVSHLVLSLPSESMVRLTDRLTMTIAVDWDVKQQTKQTMGVFLAGYFPRGSEMGGN